MGRLSGRKTRQAKWVKSDPFRGGYGQGGECKIKKFEMRIPAEVGAMVRLWALAPLSGLCVTPSSPFPAGTSEQKWLFTGSSAVQSILLN